MPASTSRTRPQNAKPTSKYYGRFLESMFQDLRFALRTALTGVVLGLIAAVALTPVLSSFLYGVTATDIPTFAAVCSLFIAAVCLASPVPARGQGGPDCGAAARVGAAGPKIRSELSCALIYAEGRCPIAKFSDRHFNISPIRIAARNTLTFIPMTLFCMDTKALNLALKT